MMIEPNPLTNTELLHRIRRIVPYHDADRLIEQLAWACWSMTVEPGDSDAGALMQTLGVCAALEHVWAIAAHDSGRELPARVQAGSPGASKLDPNRDWSAAVSRWRQRMRTDRFCALLDAAHTIGSRFISPADAAWPVALNDLGEHRPMGLWVRGNPKALTYSPLMLALVGSRASTRYGDDVTGEIAVAASDAGVSVVSGGAYGIDAQAHRVCLASGGNTIAVLAGGLDRLYPSGNRELLEQTITSGAVLSEVPCGTAPTRWRFLQRNRLIAALAGATIVVEAGARSGAMNTANHALTLGRALGAVPGPISSSTSVGCHRLIQEQQAELIAGPADALALCANAASPTLFDTGALGELANQRELDLGSFGQSADAASPSLPPAALRTFDALTTRTARTVDDLALRSGLTAADVRAGLSELELLGRAREQAGKWRRACAS